MFNDTTNTSDILRLIGFMGLCVGIAWAAQVLGIDASGTAASRLMWVLGAAAIAGAGAGSMLTAVRLRQSDD